MSKIIGVTVGTPIGVDKLKEKIKPVTSVDGVKADENGDVKVQRTHWKEVEKYYTFFSKTDLTSAVYQHSEPIGLKKGEAYEAVVNGDFYDVTPVPYEGVNGDTGLILAKNDGSVRNQYNIGLPFTFVEYDAASAAVKGYYAFVRSDLLDGNGKYYISITGDRTTYHKLDKNYLPDDLGGVKTVNGNAPDEDGNVAVDTSVTAANIKSALGYTPANETAVTGKLDKVAVDIRKEIAFGSTGKLMIGKFKVYDTQVTVDITATTGQTYNGKLVIATQNYYVRGATVYGDADNAIAPNIYIKPCSPDDQFIEVYFAPQSWSKNVIHIYGNSIKTTSNICTSVTAVPETATIKPVNALTSNFAEIGSTGGGVKTVNGKSPDENGNVQIEVNGGGGVTDYNKLENKPVGVDTVEILPETTVEIDPDNGVALFPDVLDVVSGAAYTVKWNGTEHICTAQIYAAGGQSGVALGDLGLMTGGTSTGEPFVIICSDAATAAESGAGFMVMPLDGSTSATLSITGEVVKKLDMQFLPDGYPYMEMTDILPETTVEIDPDSSQGVLPDVLDVKIGDTVTVKWNGAEYNCTAALLPNPEMPFPCIGNIDAVVGTGDTGEPFVILFPDAETAAAMGAGVMVAALDGSATVTMSIRKEVAKKIADEYLPEGMPYAQPFDDVIMAEWPTNTVIEGNWTYFADPVGKVVEGNWYKVTLGGTVYETVARRSSNNTGFVLGVGSGDDYTALYGEYPFTIIIPDAPVDFGDGFFATGGVQLENEASTDDFSIRGSLKVQEIHERCLPKTATPLIVRCDKDGVADVPHSVVEANALAGRAVYLYRFISSIECDIYSLTRVYAGYEGLRFASITGTDAGWLRVKWATWKHGNITFGERSLSPTTE